MPVLVAFVVDWTMQGAPAGAVLGARRAVRAAAGALVRRCDVRASVSIVALLLLAVLGMAVFTSFIKLWPYDLSFSAAPLHVRPRSTAASIDAYFNSLKMALVARCSARCSSSPCAYLLEKTRGMAG